MPITSTTSPPTRGADQPVDLGPPEPATGAAGGRRRWPLTRADLLVGLVFVTGAWWVTNRLWLGSGRLRTAANPADEDVF